MAQFGIYEDSAGDYRWRLTSGSDIIADSGEGYSSKRNAQEAVTRIQEDASDADVLDAGTPHFELYQDRAEEYRWRLIASNGRIVADSGEGYSSESGARKAIETVQSHVGTAEVADD